MKIVIAPDSFKESLSSEKVCRSIQAGIKKVFPKAEIVSVPMADGGEGTMRALVNNSKGSVKHCRVTAPLGNRVQASYGLIDRGETAVIEMAEASGLALVPIRKRNPLLTTSYGTGEIIRNALDLGCRKIILTLGGIATNDAGAGMAEALGYRLLDAQERKIPRGAAGLKCLHRIDIKKVHPKIKETRFIAACDVKNPLCGAKGSAAVYGPQKGATPTMVKEIDTVLRHFAKIVKRDLGMDVLHRPGTGAAGGAGAGAMAFLNAELGSGIDIVIESARLKEKMRGADILITGEGRIDNQTLFGKTAAGVAKIAKEQGCPVIAFCADAGAGFEKVHSHGIDAVFTISRGPISYRDSIRNASKLLEETAGEVMRFLAASKK